MANIERIMNKQPQERSTIEHILTLGDCSTLDYGEFISTIQALHQQIAQKITKDNQLSHKETLLLILLSCSNDHDQADLGIGAIMLNLPPEQSEPLFALIHQHARSPQIKATLASKLIRPTPGVDFETHMTNLINTVPDLQSSLKVYFSPTVNPPKAPVTIHRRTKLHV